MIPSSAAAVEELAEELERWIVFSQEAVHSADFAQRNVREGVKRAERAAALALDVTTRDGDQLGGVPFTLISLARDAEEVRARLENRRGELELAATLFADVGKRLTGKLGQVQAWIEVARAAEATADQDLERSQRAMAANKAVVDSLAVPVGRRALKEASRQLTTAVHALQLAEADVRRCENGAVQSRANTAHLGLKLRALDDALSDCTAAALRVREAQVGVANGLHAIGLAIDFATSAHHAFDRSLAAYEAGRAAVDAISDQSRAAAAGEAVAGSWLDQLDETYQAVQRAASDALNELRDRLTFGPIQRGDR